MEVNTSGEWVILDKWMLLPVPDGPVIKIGFVLVAKSEIIDEYRIVSMV